MNVTSHKKTFAALIALLFILPFITPVSAITIQQLEQMQSKITNVTINYNNVTVSNGTANASTAYPVGSIYLSSSSANPAQILGFGTWVLVGQGEVIMGHS